MKQILMLRWTEGLRTFFAKFLFEFFRLFSIDISKRASGISNQLSKIIILDSKKCVQNHIEKTWIMIFINFNFSVNRLKDHQVIHNFISSWLVSLQIFIYSSYQSMASQVQSTNCSFLQQQMKSLQQLVEGLAREGLRDQLSNLLTAVPIIQKLNHAGLDIGFSINGIDMSEPNVLKQFAQELKQSVSKMQQKIDLSEVSSSRSQKFFQTFQKNIYLQMSKVYRALEENSALDRLNAFQRAFKTYLDKSQYFFKGYIQSTNPSTNMQQVLLIYCKCLNHIFATYIDIEIQALKSISRKSDNAEKHGYAFVKIKKNQENWEKKEKKEKKEKEKKEKKKDDYEDQEEDEEEASKKEEISQQEKPKKLKTEEDEGFAGKGKDKSAKSKLLQNFLKKRKANLNSEQ